MSKEIKINQEQLTHLLAGATVVGDTTICLTPRARAWMKAKLDRLADLELDWERERMEEDA